MGYLREVLGYDDSSVESIYEFAKAYKGKTFLDIANRYGMMPEEAYRRYCGRSSKGGLGTFLEEVLFGYKANSVQEPDFSKAGLELKATPYVIQKKNKGISAKERLVVTMIGIQEPVEMDFYKSHLWSKIRTILLFFYLHDPDILKAQSGFDRLCFTITYINVFRPSASDLLIIRQDYSYIVTMIHEGKAHLLSEADTVYLGACTKGSGKGKDMIPQYYNADVPAGKRAYCLKQSYMTYVLRGIAEKEEQKKVTPALLENTTDIQNNLFEKILVDRVNQYVGLSIETLLNRFGMRRTSKDFMSRLVFEMLGVKSNNAEEFIKANIKVKTIKLEENGSMKEKGVTLFDICFLQMAEEDWIESQLYQELQSTKYFFVLFKKKGESYYLQGCVLWNMPLPVIFGELYDDWKEIMSTLRLPSILIPGKIVENRFPKPRGKNDALHTARIVHVNTHSSQTYYRFADGSERIASKATRCNGDTLPTGEVMTKCAMYLNKDYITDNIVPLILGR